MSSLLQGPNPLLSVVTPAYNEARNLPVMYDRLREVLDGAGLEWEWVVVDDHSRDESFQCVSSIAYSDPRVRALRLAHNFGAHAAVMCGLDHARGGCSVVLAGDLQDPPEVIPQLIAKWKTGAQVVWAVRAAREGESASTVASSRLYYWLMRRVVGIKELPSTGADFFLIDCQVIQALSRLHERNVSIFALITWMGFRQDSITYDKQARLYGRSGWTLEKKLKLMIDSVTSFTYLPIRLMSYLGFMVALLGFAYAGVVTYNGILGRPPEGWASLMIVVLLVGGIQMLMMGVLGEYLWRALDEARQRPRYLVESETENLRGMHD